MGFRIIVSHEGVLRPLHGNVSPYAVSGEATPVSGGDSSGAVGSISFSVLESELGAITHNDTVLLEDDDRGVTAGVVTNISKDHGIVTIEVASRLERLVALRQAGPYQGTLKGALEYYLSLADITEGIIVDDTLANIEVVIPGWDGDVWTNIKDICSTYGGEISLVSNNIVFRAPRQNTIKPLDFTSKSYTLNRDEVAVNVEVVYQNTRWVTNEVVFPWTSEDDLSLSAEAGQTVEYKLSLDGSLQTISQPVAVDFVPSDYDGTTSVFSLLGSSGYPIRGADWVKQGGSLTAALDPTGREVTLTLKGAGGPDAPYKIGTLGPPADWGTGKAPSTGIKMRGATGQQLPIPTPESPPGGQTTHPSVLKFDTPWNGYKYWMGHTPYRNGIDAYEDPCIVASQNGTKWVVPAGMQNPIDDAPGGRSYNSDINIQMGPDGKMWVFWRRLDRDDKGKEEKLYYSTSTDGVTWTPKVLLRQADSSVEGPVSPSFIWNETSNVWDFWAVDMYPSPNKLIKYVNGVRTVCTVKGIPAGKELWHMEVRKLKDGTYASLFTFVDEGTAGLNGTLGFARSSDGISWNVTSSSIIPQSKPSWHSWLYKASFIQLDDKGHRFDVWYSAWRIERDVPKWDVFRTTIEEVPPHDVPGITPLDLLYTKKNMPVQPKEGEDTVSLPDAVNGISLVGTGAMTRPKTLTIPTGVPPYQATQQTGVTIDSPFVATLQDAYTAGIPAAIEYGAPSQTISFGTDNLEGYKNAFDKYPIYGYNEVTPDSFDNQVFGNAEGSRIFSNDGMYRVRSVTYGPGALDAEAEADTTFADFNAMWADKTFAEFNAYWGDKTFAEFTLGPLRGKDEIDNN